MGHTYDAVRFVQKRKSFYATALPVSLLIRLQAVDVWREKGNRKGYQRSRSQSHVNAIEKYLENDDSLMPGAGLLNLRKGHRVTFKPLKDSSSSGAIAGKLDIPEQSELWVVDMQHRLAAFDEIEGHRDFLLPVVICDGLEQPEEAGQFYLINRKAKKIPVDLTERLLVHHGSIQRYDPDFPRWKIRAVQIAIDLGSKGRGSNPWYGRIQLPNEVRLPTRLAKENSVVTSLGEFLDNDEIESQPRSRLAAFLMSFWTAIENATPEAFGDSRRYNITGTTAMGAWHQIAVGLYRKHRRKSARALRSVLDEQFKGLANLGPKYWLRGSRSGASAFGTGRSAQGRLADALEKHLHINS